MARWGDIALPGCLADQSAGRQVVMAVVLMRLCESAVCIPPFLPAEAR